MRTCRSILIGSWLMAFTLSGCATPNKLQQALNRNTASDVGQSRVDRKDKLALDFDRTRDEAQFNAAASSWERGDQEGCRRLLEQLLDRNPKHIRGRLMLADWYLFNGQAERSAEELNKALAAEPKNALAHHSLAQVLEACGRRDEAMAQYKTATELEPANEVYAQSYKMAVDLAPTAASKELLAAQSTRLDDLKKSSASEAGARADQRVQLARGIAAPVVAPAPLAPVNNKNENRGERLFATGRIDDWTKPVDAGMPVGQSRQTREIEVLPIAESTAKASGNASQASAIPSPVQLASWNAPDGGRSNGPAVPAFQLTSPAQSTDAAEAGMNPQSRQNPLREAVVALAQGNIDAAIVLAQRGLAETPAESAALYRVMGAAHYRRGEYQTAQTELAQALSLDNHDALSYFLMSATMEKLNDHPAAARYRAQAARLDARFSQ